MKTSLAGILALLSMSSVLLLSGHAEIIRSVPFTIKKSGTYTLEKDLTYSGASGTGATTVNAFNVVLDLNGFSLTGTGNPTFNGQIAINVAGQTNVTVQNGTVTGFTTGVDFNGGAQELVQNLRLFNTTISVTMQGSSSSTIQNCFIVGTGNAGEGVELVDCSGVVVKNNQIANAGSAGASTLTNGNIFTTN
jgi:Right handed beta helix region